jgi:catechol 2,3-dioxygenase-like lactoylglutathione lyase family enzyme
MKLNAIGVTASDLQKTVDFYKLLGFQFPEFKPDEQHLEPLPTEGSARLMIDALELTKSLIGEDPKPSNHSAFALEYDSAVEVNEVAAKVKEAGFKVDKEPWDAFWGQRYAVIEDPDGYKVDLYAAL